MRLIAIPKARALAIVEIDSLGFGGKVRLADCVGPIVERYNFLKFPQQLADFDLDKGIHFENGKAGEFFVDSLVVYEQALFVDTLSSTDDSKRILTDMLEWGTGALGLAYSPQSVSRWCYISQLIFETEFPLLQRLSPPLLRLSEKISGVTNETFGGLPYEVATVYVGHDPLVRKFGIASFSLQHRANFKFEENRFFCEAPLPTHLHIKFLEELEKDVLATGL